MVVGGEQAMIISVRSVCLIKAISQIPFPVSHTSPFCSLQA